MVQEAAKNKIKRGIMQSLKNYTWHENIFLAQRGNKAIFAALDLIKETSRKNTILIPDQGGWITHLQYAKELRFNIKTLETNYGVIDPSILKENMKDAAAIIYSNPAGYFAEQPVKEIYEICRKNEVLVILDISGCIGSDFYKGGYTDMAVCSFGRWKPINLGYGGFISVKGREIYEKNEGILKKLEFDESYDAALRQKLENLKKRYEFFEKTNKKIKDELKNFNILHKSKKGINVIVKFSNDDEKNKIISYCEKNKYELVVCPKLIRVNENAISIEVKRLE